MMKRSKSFMKSTFIAVTGVVRIFPLLLWRRVRGKTFCFFIAFVFLSWAPIDKNDDCINEVHNMYKKMDINELDKGFIYMNFTMITQAGNEAKKNKVELEYIVGKERVQFQTAEMKVFIDKKDKFTIIPSRKVIYWTTSLMGMGKENGAKGYQLLQDSMFTNCKLITCKPEINTQQHYNKVVAMAPVQRAKKTYPYDKIVFYINTTTNEIKKVLVYYPAKAEFSQVEIVYNKVIYNYHNSTLSQPVKNLVFESGEKLNKEYNDFKLIDERVKTKKQ